MEMVRRALVSEPPYLAMAAAHVHLRLPLREIQISRYASVLYNTKGWSSPKFAHTLKGTVNSDGSTTKLESDSGELELDVPFTDSTKWKSIGKRKVAMRVGYVGTNYRGLQIQRDSGSVMTIEDELERAIWKVGGMLDSNYGNLHKIGWRRSSRTDKGVHSLATVLAVKMEIPDGAWAEDPDGTALADVINKHLPNNIRIFSILPVNKRFDARMECIGRSYVYLLPAEVIGIENNSTLEEIEDHIKDFRAILQMFEGRHPFHNYTVRAKYRSTLPKTFVQLTRSVSLVEKVSKLESKECKGKLRSSSDNTSPNLGDKNLNLQDISDVEEPLNVSYEDTENGSTTSNAPTISTLPRAKWLHMPDDLDRIGAAHFRKIHSCTCGGLETFKSAQYIEICIHGESFMLHQIRKMVGTAVAVKRSLLPRDLIPISLGRFSRVVLPLAPSEVLILSSNEFSFPKKFHSQDIPSNSVAGGFHFELSRLMKSDKIQARVNDFYSSMLLPEIANFLDFSKPLWKGWLEILDKHSGIPDAEMNELRKSWTQWQESYISRKQDAS